MASIFDMFASQIGEGELDQIAQQLGADKTQTRDAISMSLPALIEALARRAEQSGGADDLHDKLGQAGRATQNKPSGGGSMLDQLNDILGQSGTSAPSSPPTSPTSPPASRTSQAQASRPVPTQDSDDILPPSAPPTRRTEPSTSRPVPPAPSRPSAPPAPSPAPRTSPGLPDIFGDLLGSKQGRVSDAVSKSSGLNKSQSDSLISMLGPILSSILGSQAAEKKMSPTDLTEMIQRDRARVQQSPGGNLVGKMLDQDGDGDFDMNDMIKLGMSSLFKK